MPINPGDPGPTIWANGVATTVAGHTAAIATLPATYAPLGDVWCAPPTGIAATDLAAINAALALSSSGAPKRVRLHPGTYAIDAALVLNGIQGTHLVGGGSAQTTIVQQTAGVPILSFTDQYCHHYAVTDLTLSYAADQTNTASVAVYFDATGGLGGDYYHLLFENLVVNSAYRAFAVMESGGSHSVWGTRFSNVTCTQTKNRAFSFGYAIGGPSVMFDHVVVDNTGGTLVVSTDAAFWLNGVEATMENIAVEGWSSTVIYSTGGANVHVRGIHIEGHHLNQPDSNIFSISTNSMLHVDGFTVDAASTVLNTSSTTIMSNGSAYTCSLKNGTQHVVITAGTPWLNQVIWTGSLNCPIDVYNVVPISGSQVDMPGTGARPDSAVGLAPPHVYATRTVTTSYTFAGDYTVLANGTSLTITLPDPTTQPVGTVLKVKNLNASAASVVSAGTSKTIDGASSVSMAQWAVLRAMSDHTQWLSI